MEIKMYGELPKRADNHIRETSGDKILQAKIPSDWIIRNVTERDYGIDCYLELVNSDKKLTGELAFIQMKTTDSINWRITDKGFKFYKVEKSVTNYLSGFKIPTYLFLVDLSAQELFFLSVKEYIFEHYFEYSSSDTFAYDFSYKENQFSIDSFLTSFRKNNQYEQFRNELMYFISNMQHFIDFMQNHYYRDEFMQIETEEMLFFESLHRNISFLQNYFGAKIRLPSIEFLTKKGESIYGESYEQTLFEGVLTETFEVFKQSILEIVDFVINLLTRKEQYYWMSEKLYIYNYFNNLDTSKLFR